MGPNFAVTSDWTSQIVGESPSMNTHVADPSVVPATIVWATFTRERDRRTGRGIAHMVTRIHLYTLIHYTIFTSSTIGLVSRRWSNRRNFDLEISSTCGHLVHIDTTSYDDRSCILVRCIHRLVLIRIGDLSVFSRVAGQRDPQTHFAFSKWDTSYR